MASKLILIVDDDADYTLLLEKVCREVAAYDFRVLQNGEAAIDYLVGRGEYGDRNLNPFPDMMWVDWKMPRTGGREILQFMRENPACRVIPTIVLSSGRVPREVNVAYELGAQAYFVKPPSLTELREMLQYLCSFWLKAATPTRQAPATQQRGTEEERRHAKRTKGRTSGR